MSVREKRKIVRFKSVALTGDSPLRVSAGSATQRRVVTVMLSALPGS
jgi:hypothetical protein